VIKKNHFIQQKEYLFGIDYYIRKLIYRMPKKSSIAIFIAATSALAISTADSNSVKSGENDLGGLKEWNTDMPLDADFKLDAEAQRLADEAAKSSACIPIGEGENCW